MSEKRWAPLAAGLLAWLVLCAPVLAPGVQLGDRDTGRLYYPVKQFIAAGLRHGQLRFWDPQTEGGVSLLGQVTPALLHPLTLLYAALPFDLAFKLNHLFALLAGGLGVYWLARQHACSRTASLAGALAFGGSGALVSAASSNLPYALGPATVPLAIAAMLSRRHLLLASTLLALTAYAGDPQSLGIAILLGVSFAVARKCWKRAAAWAVAGVLLAAPVALPAIAQLRRSGRVSGMTAFESRAFSTAPARLLGLLVPRAFDAQEPKDGKSADPFGEYFSSSTWTAFLGSLLLGAPALLLALAAGRRARLALIAALILLAAATGDALGLQGVLALVVPGWRWFRYAEKLVLPASWLLSLAAAIGAQHALAPESAQSAPRSEPGAAARTGEQGAAARTSEQGAVARNSEQRGAAAAGERQADGCMTLRRLSLALALLALLSAAAVALTHAPLAGFLQRHGRSHDPDLPSEFLADLSRGLLETAALAGVMLLVSALPARRPKLALPLAALACAASALMEPQLWPIDLELFHGLSSTGKKALEIAGPSPDRWRMWVDANGALLTPGEKWMEPHAARLYAGREQEFPQLQALDGIEGLAPYFSATDTHFIAALHGAHEQLFQLFGVRLDVLQSPRPGLPAGESGFSLLERPAQPRAFLVHEALQSDSVETLHTLDIHRTALAQTALHEAEDREARADYQRPSSDRMTIATRSRSPALLVVGEHFDPGWRARIDGQDAEAEEVDLSAIGVRVPAGEHRVELRFFPRGLAAGLVIAVLTVLALLLSKRVAPAQ